jgi:crossover junction endodeoxyribonuclease RusA
VDEVTFTVPGQPAGQGSKIRNRYGGVREASVKTAPWRADVKLRAEQAMGDAAMLTGPVEILADFTLKRPKHHYGTGRNAGTLKPSAPLWCETSPDADKLARAIGDALTGVVFRDDAQIACWTIWKRYGNPGATITVRTLDTNARAVEKALEVAK